MLKEKIGLNAGILWDILDVNKELNLSELFILSKLDGANFNMAISWLYREDNISIYEYGGNQIVFLVY